MDMVAFDVILESFRVLVVAAVLLYFVAIGRNSELRRHAGWRSILIGFGLILFGGILDVTDNFPQLNRFVIVGKTAAEAFFEKFAGYTVGFGYLAFGFWKWIPSVLSMERMKEDIARSHAELSDALANVKILRGLLPICATCKKVRDDKGYWKQIELYLKEHSEARFTHGLCPECAAKALTEIDSLMK